MCTSCQRINLSGGKAQAVLPTARHFLFDYDKRLHYTDHVAVDNSDFSTSGSLRVSWEVLYKHATAYMYAYIYIYHTYMRVWAYMHIYQTVCNGAGMSVIGSITCPVECRECTRGAFAWVANVYMNNYGPSWCVLCSALSAETTMRTVIIIFRNVWEPLQLSAPDFSTVLLQTTFSQCKSPPELIYGSRFLSHLCP